MKLILNTFRDRYTAEGPTMTVGELINYLEQFDEDMPIYTGHDSQYTFGAITEDHFEDFEED